MNTFRCLDIVSYIWYFVSHKIYFVVSDKWVYTQLRVMKHFGWVWSNLMFPKIYVEKCESIIFYDTLAIRKYLNDTNTCYPKSVIDWVIVSLF